MDFFGNQKHGWQVTWDEIVKRGDRQAPRAKPVSPSETLQGNLKFFWGNQSSFFSTASNKFLHTYCALGFSNAVCIVPVCQSSQNSIVLLNPQSYWCQSETWPWFVLLQTGWNIFAGLTRHFGQVRSRSCRRRYVAHRLDKASHATFTVPKPLLLLSVKWLAEVSRYMCIRWYNNLSRHVFSAI